MTNEVPTVTCPGCDQEVELDHEQLVTGFGIPTRKIPIESEEQALLAHWDSCPRQMADQ